MWVFQLTTIRSRSVPIKDESNPAHNCLLYHPIDSIYCKHNIACHWRIFFGAQHIQFSKTKGIFKWDIIICLHTHGVSVGCQWQRSRVGSQQKSVHIQMDWKELAAHRRKSGTSYCWTIWSLGCQQRTQHLLQKRNLWRSKHGRIGRTYTFYNLIVLAGS